MLASETGEEVQGELLYDLDYDELSETNDLWTPYIQMAALEMSIRGVSPASMPDSKGWDWRGKSNAAQAGSPYADWRFFGIGYRGFLQGAIAISTTPLPCRAPAHHGQTAVGVELVATAPWNIKRFMASLRREPFLD